MTKWMLIALIIFGFPASFYAGVYSQQNDQNIEKATLNKKGFIPAEDKLDEKHMAIKEVSTSQHKSQPIVRTNLQNTKVKQLEQEITLLKEKIALLQSEPPIEPYESTDKTELTSPSNNFVGELTDQMPESYAKIVSSMGSKYVNAVKEMHAEETDYDWGVNMEQQIADFITMHEQAASVTIDSIMCKSSGCEIRVMEQQDNAYNLIKNDLEDQAWWQFSFTITLISKVDELGTHSYTLARKEKI